MLVVVMERQIALNGGEGEGRGEYPKFCVFQEILAPKRQTWMVPGFIKFCQSKILGFSDESPSATDFLCFASSNAPGSSAM